MNNCGMCETPVEHGYLCPGCTRALADRLNRMPLLYRSLTGFLTPSVRKPSGARTSRAEAPLPVSEHVLDLRGPGGIVGILEDWCTAMYRDRGHAAPAPSGDIEQRIAKAAATLRRNCPALAAEWPAVGDLAREIHDLERSVATITGAIDRPTPGHRLGPCPAEHADGTLCGATLRLPTGATVVTCTWCGQTYPPATWPDLRALIDHDTQTAA
ncbi:hypothetical protein ACFY7C_37305 [Streptomyces sp. NPDC012769]|uniref:hypothetical protein n=1 Tax=Streptomyces sp. NPDC012769 TaxID=3364848 RepID=UPI00368047C6